MINNGLEKRIRKEGFRGDIRHAVPMSEITSLRIGGPADIIFYPQGIEDLQLVMAVCREYGIHCLILGNGTNLVASDKGVREPLINLSYGFDAINVKGQTIVAEAGSGLSHLLRLCQANALSGLEALTGIPGTVGGALRMNAGSWGVELGNLISSLTVMDVRGEIREIKRQEVEFGYRGTNLPADAVILRGEFSLPRGEKKEITKRMRDSFRKKKKTQPLAQPSAGSIFKNPAGIPAGQLIEAAGLKGMRRGDAMISSLHANFIVNMGKAQARDILGLIDMIQKRVYQETGTMLELEVVIIGEAEPAA
jgi:UDP-N-acetylmuramate dehydrogenase